MKKRLYLEILFIFAVLIFFGCATPEPVKIIEEREVIREVQAPPESFMPLTPSILLRLQESGNNLGTNINRFQLLLFGRIILEREYIESNDGLAEGGAIRFENMHIRENITINDQTEGMAMAIEQSRGGIILHVCFEEDEKQRLVFTAPSNNPNSYFYLNYTPNSKALGDEKGTIQYGGQTYKVKFFGDSNPYLLIRLSQKDSDTLNVRTLPGRKVQ